MCFSWIDADKYYDVPKKEIYLNQPTLNLLITLVYGSSALTPRSMDCLVSRHPRLLGCRSFKNKQYQKEHPGGIQSNFSKMISPLWAAEPPHVKAYWKERAKEVARKHKQKYPFYTFKPVQTKRKQTGHVLKHEDEGTRAPSAEGHSPMGLSDGLGSPPSPPDLSFSSSGSSSSARTTPGLNTPPSTLGFWPLDGQSNQPQVSAQADMYGQAVQYQVRIPFFAVWNTLLKKLHSPITSTRAPWRSVAGTRSSRCWHRTGPTLTKTLLASR